MPSVTLPVLEVKTPSGGEVWSPMGHGLGGVEPGGGRVGVLSLRSTKQSQRWVTGIY